MHLTRTRAVADDGGNNGDGKDDSDAGLGACTEGNTESTADDDAAADGDTAAAASGSMAALSGTLHCEHTPGTAIKFVATPALASFGSARPKSRAYRASGDAKHPAPISYRGEAVCRNRCRLVCARCRASRSAALASALEPRVTGHSRVAAEEEEDEDEDEEDDACADEEENEKDGDDLE